MSTADRPETRLATRLAFLVAGFGVACWAPLVPYAKQRLAVDAGTLGLLLLCLGVGSVTTMLFAGVISARWGSKPVILAGAVGLTVLLPLLAIASTPWALGLTLFGFGGSLGSLDVAMNVHAVEVERAAQRPLMSGFHAHFSLGGFAGAGLMTFLLSMHLGGPASTLICGVPMLVGTVLAWPRLLRTTRAGDGPLFVLPRGVVLLLAVLAGSMFLAEGALLDWSALLITSTGLVAVTQGGLGYLLFSIAMTAGRLGGDSVVTRVGDRATLVWGGLLAVAGFVLLLVAPVAALAMAGFLLIGLGASNLVPVLFRRTGTQSVMPVGMAVAAITFTGYAGNLMGPAGIGFIAKAWGLRPAFWLLASFPALVALSARFVSVERAG